MIAFLLLDCITIFCGACSSPDTPANSLETVKEHIAQGNYDDALKHIQRLKEQLSADKRLVKWKIDLRQKVGYPCNQLLFGTKHLYFVSQPSRGVKHTLGLPDNRPILNDTMDIYDFTALVTCVDGNTGKMLWSRRLAGRYNLAIDPPSDDLLCWRKSVHRVSATKGEVVFSKGTITDKGFVEAIIFDGQLHQSEPPKLLDDRQREPKTAYDVQRGEFVQADVLRRLHLAPDEKKYLAFELLQSPNKVATTIKAVGLDKTPLWNYEYAGYTANEPIWHDGDVMALNGQNVGHAEVVRIDGDTGTVQWRYLMPRGAFCSGSDQLIGNAYQQQWSAIGMAGDHVLALGGEATLYFLDPKHGKVAARCTPIKTHLAMPRIIGDAIIVGSQLEIVAIPMDTIFDRHADGEKNLILLQARCLQGLGKYKESLAVLDQLLEHIPECPEGWSLRADLCKQLYQPLAEVAARCKYLALTCKETCPELSKRWGLINRIETNSDLQADLHLIRGRALEGQGFVRSDVIYAGTPTGMLYTIDCRSLEVLAQDRFPTGIRLMMGETVLSAYLGNRQQVGIGKPKLTTANASSKWRRYNGYDGDPVRWKGKFYRPNRGGVVLVYDGKVVQEYKTGLTGIEAWQIHLSPWGPVGYGAGGVYRLDKNLCPADMLIDIGKRGGGAGSAVAMHVADNAETIAVLKADASQTSLQVWSRDGKELLRELKISEPSRNTRTDGSLIHLAGGYFYSGSELAWLSPERNTRPWRFGVGENPGKAVPRLYYQGTPYFGRPVVYENFVIVTCRDGGIYVFDVGKLAQ